MESYRYKNNREEKQLTNTWDAFVNHIESIYFSGAADLLNRQILTFEFKQFKNNYVAIK
jgi:hypothetical protein